MGRAGLAASAAAPTPALVLSACSMDAPGPAVPAASPAPAVQDSSVPAEVTATGHPTGHRGDEPASGSRPRPATFAATAALADVRLLAGRIGPRLATGPASRRAGFVVQRRFAELGSDVRRETSHAPAGDSWGIPAGACENAASDHSSFEKAGFAVARLGSTRYAAYHSADDVPSAADRPHLARTGRLVRAWLR